MQFNVLFNYYYYFIARNNSNQSKIFLSFSGNSIIASKTIVLSSPGIAATAAREPQVKYLYFLMNKYISFFLSV